MELTNILLIIVVIELAFIIGGQYKVTPDGFNLLLRGLDTAFSKHFELCENILDEVKNLNMKSR